MPSRTLGFVHQDIDVLIVGYEINGGWRMAVELRDGETTELIRDTANVYPDFESLSSSAMWLVNSKLTQQKN